MWYLSRCNFHSVKISNVIFTPWKYQWIQCDVKSCIVQLFKDFLFKTHETLINRKFNVLSGVLEFISLMRMFIVGNLRLISSTTYHVISRRRNQPWVSDDGGCFSLCSLLLPTKWGRYIKILCLTCEILPYPTQNVESSLIYIARKIIGSVWMT